MDRTIRDVGQAVAEALSWLRDAEQDLRDLDREAEGQWASVRSALALIEPARDAVEVVWECIAEDVAKQEREEAAGEP